MNESQGGLGESSAGRWRLPGWLALHLALVFLLLWGLESGLGGAKSSQGQILGAGTWDFGFLTTATFWKETLLALLETLAIACVATFLGAWAGALIGMAASRSGVARARSVGHRLLVMGARLVLDTLRSIPDFAWALLLLTLFGAGPITGVLALALSNAGILGRLYSEQWETLQGPARALATSGQDSRLVRFFYVHRPVFAAANRSFTMLRLECSVRNASVIGVVGGGGLGGQIFEAFSLGELEKAIALFVALCALAGWTEMGSGKMLETLRPRGRRRLIFAALVGSAIWLLPATIKTYHRLARTDLVWVGGIVKRFLAPDLSWATLRELSQECALPISLAYLATLAAALLAWCLAFGLAHHRQQHWGWRQLPGGWQGAMRRGGASLSRWICLVGRTLPVEASVLLFAFAWGLGWKAALAALALHSITLLLRLYYDLLDRQPPQSLEHRGALRRMDWWAYVVSPQLWPRWRSFVFLQADANLRSGIVLGMIGVGGIGDHFHSALSFWQLDSASSCILCMLLLSLLSDRSARWLARAPSQC